MFELKNNKYTAKEYIENFFYIVNKDRERVPFLFNNVQNKLYDRFTPWNLILKGRKPGVSSQILALWLTACMFDENTRAVVISHEKEATKRLLARVYYYIHNLAVPPSLEKESENGMRFTDTNSSFWIGTAGARAFGRGDDITHLHISEYDWWNNTDMLTGVLEACVPQAYVAIETTGNGFNSPFHQLWRRAKNKQSSHTPHFFGWNDAETNIKPVTDKNFVLTTEETQLKKTYNLTDEQINWKRWKLRTMDKPELFPQEYPINDIEAFLFSGRSYFNTERLKLYLGNVEEPERVGYLKRLPGGELEFIPDSKGPLKIWKLPQPGKMYVMGADVAEGVGEDFSDAVVMDVDTVGIVATLKCDIPPSNFGRELAKVGEHFNNAYIACEVNNHGLTSLTVLKEQEKYTNLHYRLTVDKATNKETQQIGWKTTQITRPLLLDNLDRMIRAGSMAIPSKDVIEELMSFIIDKNGDSHAQAGGNDDFVFATGICLYVFPIVIKLRKLLKKGNPQVAFQHRGQGGG